MIPATPGVGRRTRRLLDPLLAQAAALPGADRYRKHFGAEAHLRILFLHALSGSPSLRQTHATLEALGWERVGLARPVSRSQLARSSTSRPSAPLELLFARLVRRAQGRGRRGAAPAERRLLQAIDSTFLELSAALCPWSRHGGRKAGVRLHVGFDLGPAIPAGLHLTLADTHDLRALAERDPAALAGWTLLIDRGYYGHRFFARLIADGVDFVVPQHAQATVRVRGERRVPAAPTRDGDVVLADQAVDVGSPTNHNSVVVPDLRLITTRNRRGEERRFLTTRRDLPARVVAEAYRRRWQIELFFRWLKHELGLVRPLGTSPQAVWLSVLLSGCVAILAVLAEPNRPPDVTRIAWVRPLAFALLLTPADSS
jgi:hypothetical protein